MSDLGCQTLSADYQDRFDRFDATPAVRLRFWIALIGAVLAALVWL